MVEDVLLDRHGRNSSNSHLLGLDYLQKNKTKNNVIDTWRKQHPNLTQLTFHNYNNLIHSRIDRIYVNENLKITKTQIMPNCFSDHEAVLLTLQIPNQNPKSQGYWKLNTLILSHKTFKKIFQTFWKNWQNQKPKYNTINKWWKLGKIYFKILTIQYSSQQNLNLKKQQNLTEKILQEKTKYTPNQNNIETWQEKLLDLENYRAQDIAIKSKEKIIINEEKPTTLFDLLERRR